MPNEPNRDAWIDSVRQATDIVEVIGRSLPLKQKGRHWWGLCPFHQEKTASFSVDAEQQLFYCFGCHKGGTVFTFLMEVEGKEFRDVVDMLAQEAGLPEPAGAHAPGRNSEEERLFAVLEWSHAYFLGSLQKQQAEVEGYLAGRGVSKLICDRFQLGYAPNVWEGLVDLLRRRGVSFQEMERAGVAQLRRGKEGAFDRWRGRLMFPIWDTRGRVVGFGGRAMLADQEPKYLNSPDTPLFRKGTILYGSHLARASWRRGERPILVEGYFDVMACHQAGLTQAVASLGTALTAHHARYLARYHKEVDLLYDGDSAGQEAMRRAFLLLSSAGLKVNAVTLAGLKDPSDMVETRGEEALKQAVDGRTPYLEHYLAVLAGVPGADSARGRAEVVERLKPLWEAVPDAVERAGYLELIGRTLRLQSSILTQSFGVAQAPRHTMLKNRHNMEVKVSPRMRLPTLDVRLLSGLQKHPERIPYVREELVEWSLEAPMNAVLDMIESGLVHEAKDIRDDVYGQEVSSMLAAVFSYQEPDGGIAAIDQTVEAIRLRRNQERWQRLMEQVGQGDQSPEVLEEVRRLGTQIGHYQL